MSASESLSPVTNRRTEARQTCARHPLRALLRITGIAAGIFFPSVATALVATDFSFSDATTQVLEFDEISMSQSTVVTNQYAATHGVSFSPNLWFENHRANIGWDGANVANFLTGTSTVNPVIEIAFGVSVAAAAFEIAANDGTSFLIESVSAGSVIESFVFTDAACCGAHVVGFRDSDFDMLRITHQAGGSQFFVADRLTWNPVPEPGTATLLLLGLTGLAARREP